MLHIRGCDHLRGRGLPVIRGDTSCQGDRGEDLQHQGEEAGPGRHELRKGHKTGPDEPRSRGGQPVLRFKAGLRREPGQHTPVRPFEPETRQDASRDGDKHIDGRLRGPDGYPGGPPGEGGLQHLKEAEGSRRGNAQGGG